MKARSISLVAAGFLIGAMSFAPSFAKDLTTGGKMSTADTTDIINTLRARGAFHTMFQGLEQTYELDNELKGKGPYTVFACDDKGWAKLNQSDKDTLFGNKKKLTQVFKYEFVKGKKLTSADLKGMPNFQTFEGQLVKVASKDNDKSVSELWLNNSRVKEADIQCSNGIVHIVDAPLMPPLAK
ncbi:MAG: fasciclin domain-containing protein [Leptolyngbya sp.]|nr:fasciclin domain-containing protein [Candidatus Melainabacteria bacterium]